MTKVVKGARFISKISEVPGVEPTIPPNDDHTLGWKDTDIYVGEWFWNITDGLIYFRDNNGISVVVTPDPATGQINPALLPGNYIGAMVYIGIWDASTGNYPGWPYPPTGDDKGNYWIVSVSGNTNLDGETDWQVGDYPIWNGLSWDKIDNSEPTIYANNVLYDNSTYTSLTNVDEALEKIFDEKFITPAFDKTVTIDVSGFAAGWTALQVNGNSPNWINWDGSALGLGTNSELNSVLKVGPKGVSYDGSPSLTSTLDLHWYSGGTIATGNEERLRWRTYSSNTDGFILGYNDSGEGTPLSEVNANTKISAMGDSYLMAGEFGVGIKIPEAKMHIRSAGAIYSGTPSLLVSDSTARGTVFIESEGDFPTDLVFKNNSRYSWDISTRDAAANYALTFYASTTGTGWAGVPVVTMLTDGKVGINKIPTEALDVNGAAIISSILTSNSATIATDLDVGNDLHVTGTTTLYNNAIISTNLNVGGTLGITGLSTFTSKASYNNYATVTIDDLNDITHKNYVDDEILAHAVGWWVSGTTQTPTLKDVVVHSGTITYKVGINKLDPSYDLDVVGNVNITSTVDIGGNTSIDSNLTVLDTTNKLLYITSSLTQMGDIDNTTNGNYLEMNISSNNNLTYYGAPATKVFEVTGAGNVEIAGTSISLTSTSSKSINTGVSTFTIQSSDRTNLATAEIRLVTGDVNGVASSNKSGDIDIETGKGGGNSTGLAGNGGRFAINLGDGGAGGGNLSGGTGGDMFISLGTGGNIGAGAGSGGDGGSFSLYTGNGRRKTTTGGKGGDGGSIIISSGDGGDKYISGVAGNGGDIIISSGDGGDGNTGSVAGVAGKIYIDHIINETKEYSMVNSTSTPQTQSNVIPSFYNFINLNMNCTNYVGGNVFNLYLGNLQLPNNDVMVTISGKVHISHTAGNDYFTILKNTSGTNVIFQYLGLSHTSEFVTTLIWNHVQSTWGIVAYAYDGSALSKPNGNII